MYFKDFKMGNKIDLLVRGLVVSACLVYLIVFFPVYEPLPSLTSKADAVLLNSVGVFSIPVGRYLVVSFENVDRIYELSWECCGLVVYVMFLVGVFVAPGFSLRHRLLALAFLPVLFLGNVFRIMLGVLAGVHFSVDASVFFHNTFGQVLIFFWVLVCFIVWLRVTDNFPKDSLEGEI